MAYDESATSARRLLDIYTRLLNGEALKKEELMEQYHVSDKTIRRTICDVRDFLENECKGLEIQYDRAQKAYKIAHNPGKGVLLDNNEVLAACEILLASRSLVKAEMEPILDKLIACNTSVKTAKALEKFLRNERFYYIEPHHQTPVLSLIGEIRAAIQNQLMVDIDYLRMKDQTVVTRRVKPVGLTFSQFYFYLHAHIDGIDKEEHFADPEDKKPTRYRVDRIRAFRPTKEHFSILDSERFEEGVFRKQAPYMYGGKLETVRFIYTGPSIEAVLDYLPDARVGQRPDGGWDVSVDMYVTDAEMWLRSQGDYVSVQSNTDSKLKG